MLRNNFLYPLLEMFQVDFIKYKTHNEGRIRGGGERGAVPPPRPVKGKGGRSPS